jgi:CubicO group peptidase (beta-lactamase class C family)
MAKVPTTGEVCDVLFQKKVRVFPVEEVTTRDPNEVPPESVGLTQKNVDAIWRSVEWLYRVGLHPSIGLCIRRHGKIVLNRSIGHERGNAPGDSRQTPKVLATPDTLFNVYSVSKMVVAMLIHLLDQRGLLHIGDAVAEYIPNFGKHSKQWITIRHILSHRAGIPHIPSEEVNLDLLTQPNKIIELLCEASTQSRPGRELAYHALTGGWILGEIVERVTGKSLREVLKEEFGDPLGMTHFNYGVSPEDVHKVAQNAYTGPAPFYPYAKVFERSLGVTVREAVTYSNDPRFLTSVIPAGNLICTAEEMTRFLDLLCNAGVWKGQQIFEKRTIRRAVSEQSYLEMDGTLVFPIRYSLGFMLGARVASPFGHNIPRGFGHLGFTNVLAYTDPERKTSVALMNTGKPFITLQQLVWLNVARVISNQIPRETPDW